MISKPRISVQAAKQLLEGRGYLIIAPLSLDIEDVNLIRAFYDIVRRSVTNPAILAGQSDISQDCLSLRRFYQKGRLIGLSNIELRQALLQSVDNLGKFYGELKLKRPISSFSFFISKSAVWIHDLLESKALEYKIRFSDSEEGRQYLEKIYNDCSDQKFKEMVARRRKQLIGES